ncbi:two-component system, LytT family, response regulator [Pedobacter terrae]|uniref:Two-component system, LytT family, response regulator n=1 Tax=Pedobacter terrae TaxID=405671 RepID=A0A1G8AAG6_9SPHI|nr:LytTR family DNA-binding domain-containing protein [Pedobacter terrae]SDH17843.1 two-component system, LytT family, response regulator [Pedobacter terrae]
MKLTSVVIDDEPHAAEELELLIGRTPGIENKKTFHDVSAAIEFLDDFGKVDIIFCDISMPEINGLDAGKILSGKCMFLIYVTAYREYALEAFGVNAAGYLMKPLSHATLIEKIDDLRKRTSQKSLPEIEDGYILAKGSNKNSFNKIEISQIVYIEALLNYIKIYTTKEFFITYVGLKDVEEILGQKQGFIRISRSVIISMRYLEKVEGNVLKLHDAPNFTVGETFRSDFYALLKRHSINPG